MRFFASLFILQLVFAVTKAQQLPLETYTPANGLVDARVTKMFQDSKGRIYFLTREGFSIFDGQHFDNYAGSSNNSNIINDITEYADGTIKLFCFDGSAYLVKNNKVSFDSSQKKLLTEINSVTSIADNEKIIITNLAVLKEKNGILKKIPTPFLDTPALHIDGFIFLNNYLLFSFSNNKGKKAIYLYNYKTFSLADSLIGTSFTFASANKNGTGFIYANKWLKVEEASLKAGKIKLKEPSFTNALPAAFKKSLLYIDTENNFLFVNNQLGYCKIDAATNTKFFFPQSANLLANSSNVFQDAEKNYWFIAFGNGVQKLQQSPLKKIIQLGNTILGDIKGINTDEKNNLFTETAEHFFLNEKKLADKKNSLAPPSFYWQKQFWTFTDYKTLQSSSGKIYHLENYYSNYRPESYQPAFVTIDNEGRLLIGGHILIMIDTDYKLYMLKLPYYADNICTDEENNYWAFCRGSYAVKCVFANQQLKKVYEKYFDNINPRFAVALPGNRFACGTRFRGIVFLKWQNGEITEDGVFDKSKGLSNNFVYCLYKKNNEQLIAGTGTGLDIINFSGADTICENVALRNNLFTPFTYLTQGSDSAIYCQSINAQLYRLEKEMKFSSAFQPIAYFKKIAVNNKEANGTVTFSYSQNNFSFSISAPSFIDNKNTKYFFLLKGNGQQWQQNTASADFSINNLLPGTYTLKVTVQFAGRVYADQQLTYSFVIKNPFWKQWWFLMLVILVIGLTGFYFVRSYYRRKLEKQQTEAEKLQAIEKERTRIATDMHDDFGASLSRIKFISEKIQLTKNDDAVLKNDLFKISAYSDEMAQKMNEIVWALNQRYDSLEDLVSFCRSYAADFLQDKNIQLAFTATISVNRMLPGEIRRNIFLVIKEALNNIVKHAGASKVSILFTQNQQLLVVINDNGKGIDLSAIRPFANGLQNMKKRIEEINGTFMIKNKSGTTISLAVPL